MAVDLTVADTNGQKDVPATNNRLKGVVRVEVKPAPDKQPREDVAGCRDALSGRHPTPIPLAPGDVAGALNLHGRIVTAIDLRRRLQLPPRDADDPEMSVVVDYGGELYSLNVDTVGEVLSLPVDDFDSNPSTLNPVWRSISAGIYRLKEELLVVLDVERLLDLDHFKPAA